MTVLVLTLMLCHLVSANERHWGVRSSLVYNTVLDFVELFQHPGGDLEELENFYAANVVLGEDFMEFSLEALNDRLISGQQPVLNYLKETWALSTSNRYEIGKVSLLKELRRDTEVNGKGPYYVNIRGRHHGTYKDCPFDFKEDIQFTLQDKRVLDNVPFSIESEDSSVLEEYRIIKQEHFIHESEMYKQCLANKEK